MKQANYAVFIGRFQPFHYGHASVIHEGLKVAERVIVLVGSANCPRSLRNPFTYRERANVIEEWAISLNESITSVQGKNPRVVVAPLNDFTYRDNEWISAVQHVVSGVTLSDGWRDRTVIKLIGHSKDHTSYYLSLFPTWGHVDVPAFTSRHMVNSTEVRNFFFTNVYDELNLNVDLYTDVVPPATIKFLDWFLSQHEEEWKNLIAEKEFIEKYKQDHKFAGEHIPYSPTHVTADAVVVQSGHVLLIRRKTFPGKGLWALPGGFVNQYETIDNAIIRELREETKIKVPPAILKSNMTKKEVFDNPNRSPRGRIITHAGLIELPLDTSLPKVKGSDDADKAKWIPIGELNPTELYEDHYHIIKKMVSDR